MANGKPWLPEHTQTLLRLAPLGYSNKDIAAVTGHHKNTVMRQRHAMGLDRCRKVGFGHRTRKRRVA